MDDNRLPPPPLTPLAQGAVAHFELFITYVHAGFKRREALEILLEVMRHGLENGSGPC